MKSEKTFVEIEALRFLVGEVTAVQSMANSLSASFTDYGTIADIPISYLCQDGGMNSSYTAFSVGDDVLAEWNVPVVESPTPTKDSLRILGFSDGVIRCCDVVIICLRYKKYVMFYSCSGGKCHVPDDWIEASVETVWGSKADGWMYFKLLNSLSEGDILDFIEDVMGGTTAICDKDGVETRTATTDSDETIIDEEAGKATDGPLPGSIDMPAHGGGSGETYCNTYVDRTYTGGNDSFMGWEKVAIKQTTYTFELETAGGVNLIPEGWSTGYNEWVGAYWEFDQWMYATTDSRMFLNNVAGDAYSERRPRGEGYVASYHSDTLDGDGKSNDGALAHKDRVQGGNMFLANRGLLADWRTIGVPYAGTGSGGTDPSIDLPSWLTELWPALPQTYPPSAQEIRPRNAYVMPQSKDTAGILYGTSNGSDWSFGGVGEKYYGYCQTRVGGHTPAYLTEHFEQDCPDPGFCSKEYWYYSEFVATKNYVAISVEGRGREINTQIYRDIQTEASEIFSKDVIERDIVAQRDVHTSAGTEIFQAICYYDAVFDRCSRSRTGGTPIPPENDHLSESIAQAKWNGGKVSLHGRLYDYVGFVTFKLIEQYNEDWRALADPDPDPSSFGIGVYSCDKPSDMGIGEEWAEDRVNYEEASWLVDFFTLLIAAAPPAYDDIYSFLHGRAGGDFEYRYLVP